MPHCGSTKRLALSSVLLAIFTVLSPEIQSNAQSNAQSSLPASANELVRQVIENELKPAPEGEKFFYVVRRITPTGEQTEEYVETEEGAVGRLIAIDDHPLTAQQQEKEDAKLQKLATDPETQKKHRKEQKDQEEHINKIVRAMPDAFIFEYDGRDDSLQDRSLQSDQLIRLRFKPDPNFNPPNRETQVYKGMEGIMVVDATDKHLAKIDAILTREVTFGWGIFGHLDKGGAFEVEQTRIGPNRWDLCKLKMKLSGRILLFKKLNVDEKEFTGSFRPAPPHLSLVEGVGALKQQNVQLAIEQSEANSPAK